MLAFSAADSVSAAIQRTRDFLFSRFQWGTYLKLGLVAILTEGSWSNLRSSQGGGGHPSGHGPMIYSIPGLWIAAAVAASLLAIFVSLVVVYLITRLRFAYFHCLVHNTREIRPGWVLYREPATRFFWMNVVVGLCFLVVIGVAALPFVAGLWRLFQEMKPGGHLDVGLLLAVVLPMIPVILLLVLIFILTDVVLRDFMLPHFAVDNATAGEAWHAVWNRFKAEKKQFVVYAILRLVLPTVAMALLFMVLLIPGAIVAGSLGAIMYAIHSAFAHAAGGAAVAGMLLQAFFGVVGLCFALLATVCLGGPLSTGIREYALMFYGGRYPALGDMLYPSPAPPLPETGAPVIA